MSMPLRTRSHRVAVPFAGFFLLTSLLAGCRPEASEIAPEEWAQVTHLGEPAAGALLRTLVGRLTGAVEEGGVVHAMEFCSTEAIPLTRMVEADLEGNLSLKRTSFRYRNPDNAPDQAEEEALRYFEDAVRAGGSAPSSYVQRAGEDEYRYYQPLFVGELCLQCHGDSEIMDSEVRQVLRERYPGDLATGYRAGDLRGVVRVSIPSSAVEG
jgi:hypothetical protein